MQQINEQNGLLSILLRVFRNFKIKRIALSMHGSRYRRFLSRVLLNRIWHLQRFY